MALQPVSTSLNIHLSDPATPWNISLPLLQRLNSAGGYKKCEVTPQDPEWNFVHQYFNQHPPTNRVISHIYCIHNPSQTDAFKAEIRSMEKEASNPTFAPAWNKEDNALLRQKVIDRWNNATAPYTPFSISFNDQRKESFSKTRILPLWHGSDAQKCNSICSSGFAIFGKHAYLKGGGDTSSTDVGFFGSGIYFTNSARYSADIYSNGHMLLAWVSMREPFPVIADKAHPQKPSDMKKLEGLHAYKNYNAHYVPVISIKPNEKMCSVYYPCTSMQAPVWDEIVVFQKSQTLPRFWVELAVNLPASIPQVTHTVQELLTLILDALENTDIQNNPALYETLEKKSGTLIKYSKTHALSGTDLEFYQWAEQLINAQNKVRHTVAKKLLELSPSLVHTSLQTLASPPANSSIITSVAPGPVALPSIAFGKAEWSKYFGDVGVEPPLPSDIHTILQSACPFWPHKKVQETHLLVLIPQTVNGKPLNLQHLGELIQKPLQGTSTKYHHFKLGEYKDNPTIKSHWVLLTRDVVEGSRNKSYSDQQALILGKKHYEVPNVLDATVAILMEYVRTGTRLYNNNPYTYTRCQEKWNKDYQFVVGGFSGTGLGVARHHSDFGFTGLGGLRKFY